MSWFAKCFYCGEKVKVKPPQIFIMKPTDISGAQMSDRHMYLLHTGNTWKENHILQYHMYVMSEGRTGIIHLYARTGHLLGEK